MATSEHPTPQFKLPPESKVSDEEESFVVLGKSLVTDFNDLSFDERNTGASIIQEAKDIIQKELDQMEQQIKNEQSTQGEMKEALDKDSSDSFVGNCSTIKSEFQSANYTPAMDQSTVLPSMPAQLSPSEVDSCNSDTSRMISIISFAPSDFASEELQNKVAQLIDENTHLKDTIIQNNMSMKAHYDRIIAWQNDVEKVHEVHKEKFVQAKHYIEELKKENVSLKIEIDHLKKRSPLEHKEMNRVMAESSEVNLKEFELSVAYKKIKELEGVIETMSLRNHEMLGVEKSNMKKMEEKLLNYEKELEKAYKEAQNSDPTESQKVKLLEEKLILSNTAIVNANKEIVSLQSKLAISLQLTDDNGKTALDSANKEVLFLQSQLAKSLQLTDDNAKITCELQQANNKIKELEELLASRNVDLIDADIRSKKTDENLAQATEIIKNLEETIRTLNVQIEEAKIEVWKQKQKVQEHKQRGQEICCKPEEIAYLRQQLMQSQMALTQSNQTHTVAYAQLEKYKSEIADLRAQLSQKETEKDTLFALETQLEVYKSDFQAEREVKEDIKREKEKLSEDLQHLHRRNQQLQEEIELCRNQLLKYENPTHYRQERSSNASASPPLQRYTCPICNIQFRSLKLVEDHLETCVCHSPW